jgi:hypothetical protein
MKFVAALFCLVFAFAGMAGAQEVITPTNRIELFNGRDFSGWTFCMRSNASPALAWSVTNGVIHCTGTPSGYLRTKQDYREYQLSVEWRFVKIAPQADNTGILVHLQLPDRVWPRCVQVQGKHGRQGDLFLMAGAESREHHGLDANTPLPRHGDSAENLVGEWNTCVTVCSGKEVKTYVNGRFTNETTGCSITHGAIGIQSEGGEIEIRRMSLAPPTTP